MRFKCFEWIKCFVPICSKAPQKNSKVNIFTRLKCVCFVVTVTVTVRVKSTQIIKVTVTITEYLFWIDKYLRCNGLVHMCAACSMLVCAWTRYVQLLLPSSYCWFFYTSLFSAGHLVTDHRTAPDTAHWHTHKGLKVFMFNCIRKTWEGVQSPFSVPGKVISLWPGCFISFRAGLLCFFLGRAALFLFGPGCFVSFWAGMLSGLCVKRSHSCRAAKLASASALAHIAAGICTRVLTFNQLKTITDSR